ncbi:MAG: MMPL family transporter [Dehalococcoidia bacterium]
MLEALGRVLYRRRYVVLAVWALVILLSLPFAPRAGDQLKPGGFSNESFPSVQARELMQERLGLSTISVELIFQHEDWTPFQPEFMEAVSAAADPLRDLPEVISVRTHLDDQARASSSIGAVHVTVGLDLELEESVEFLDTVIAQVDPGPLDMTVTGGPALYRDISLASERDLRRGETVAFPLATITLLLVFGTVVAAITPAAVGGAGVAIGLAAVFWISRGVDMSVFALNIVTLLGIGIGIDYSLFYTSRFREELARGRDVAGAIAASQTHAGRAILFSAATSLAGLVSLVAFDIMMLRSVGIGAVVVIFAALVAALTLLPALLGVLGHRVNRLRVIPDWEGRPSFWAPLARWVMSRPVLVLLPTAAVLIVLAAPVTHLRLGTVDATILPADLESRQGFDLLQRDFGLDVNTAIPVVYTFGDAAGEDGDPFSDENLADLYAFGRALEGLDDVEKVTSFVNLGPEYSLDTYRTFYAIPESVTDATAARLISETLRPGVALFMAESQLHPFAPEAGQLVAQIRAFDPGPGSSVHVNGGAGDLKDIVDALYSRFPIVVAVVLGVTYLSLMLLFRSVVLPLKAVILNVLSILASYGVLVFVFQDGNLSGLLGFEPLGVIEATTPILLFAILFGLSMDYEIFLLSRVAEAYRRTGDNTASVVEGLQRSGLIITGAAAILIVVAASFVAADVVLVKAIGLGLAIAVFVDVTLVRALVAPALMRLFGKWNWWLPGWLDRLLPEVRHVS